MRTYYRTSRRTGVSFGLLGTLAVMVVMVAVTLVVWACRVVGLVAAAVVFAAVWCWRRVHNDEAPQPGPGGF